MRADRWSAVAFWVAGGLVIYAATRLFQALGWY